MTTVSARIQSVRVRPTVVYVRVGKDEIEIPRGQLQDWLESVSAHRLDMLIALAIREQLAVDSNLANLAAGIEGKRVVLTIGLQN